MNQAMKIENILEFIEAKDIASVEHDNFIFGYIEPKFWKYIIFQTAAVVDLKNLLIFFSEEQIILVGLSLSGDFTEDIFELSRKDIQDFTYKKGMIQSKIIFKYNGSKVVIKTPQVVLTSKWQMTNLKYLVESNFFQK